MKITMTRDDVTGAELTDSQEVPIKVGDVSGTLDLGPDSLAALISLANGEGPGKLSALLAPMTPARRGRKPGSGSGARDGKPDPVTGASPDDIRKWAATQGITVNARGRVPADVREKYRVAHASGPAPASAPASTRKTGNAPDASAEAVSDTHSADAAGTTEATTGKTTTRK